MHVENISTRNNCSIHVSFQAPDILCFYWIQKIRIAKDAIEQININPAAQPSYTLP